MLLLCSQLPVKMVRCGQHATLAVQLAASSAPLWGRKSTSSAAVPTIAEEDASCGAYSGSASPPHAASSPVTKPSCREGAMKSALESGLSRDMHSASSPRPNGAIQADSAASQTSAVPTQQGSAAENGNQGHGSSSKEPLTGLVREVEAERLPSKGVEAPAVPASEVFREYQPCRRPAKPLQGFTTTPIDSAHGELHANGGLSGNGLKESGSYIEGRVGGSYVKLAQLHPPGSMAAQSQMLSDSAGAGARRPALDCLAQCKPPPE